ncbi:MAG: TRC40/GET3/ArsA family transport-energizing ATPase [Promethearchaeota archaeon]
MRLIIFGGKGGVGKSSISAATAVKLASIAPPNKRVLLISFDIAHNLGDLFSVKIGNDPTMIKENLWVIEPDSEKYAEKYTNNFAEKMRSLAKGMPIVGKIPQLEEFIETTFKPKSIPLALKNAMFFQRLLDAEKNIKDIGEKDEDAITTIAFDYVIADFPPTGNMIALFEVPQNLVQVLLKYSLNTMSHIREFTKKIKKATKIFRPFSWGKQEVQKNLALDILKMLQELEDRGERVTKLMKEKGSLRLVTIAEKPSYEEIKRGKELTKKYINLDAVYINQLIHERYIDCKMCNIQITNQNKYIKLIEETFDLYKIWISHKLTREPLGWDGLLELADEIYGKDITIEDIIQPKR